jgi:hypothetical protein
LKRPQDFEFGKRGELAGDVHYIARRSGVDAKSFGRLSNTHGIIGFDGFLFKFKFPFPRLNLRWNASITRDSNGRVVHDTGRDVVGSWTWARPAGTARMMNRAPVPCPHGLGRVGQHGPQGFRPKLEIGNNPLLKSIKTKR